MVAEVKQQISFEELSGKMIAIDAYNAIYQFLSIIRQPDGTPLTDSKGRVTSHLSGLFYRTTNLLEYGIKPIYVFDGIPPQLKKRTLEARMNRRKEAMEAWAEAKEKGMLEEARMHAMASTRINKEIVESSKELLRNMGIPYIQAPSEGEAEAAYLVKKKLVYALASQDYDSFLLGAQVVIRNFAITGRRKLPKKNVFVEVSLERIFLEDLLKKFSLSLRQLILLGILVGTDFNSGIDKVGPKTALKIVSEKKTPDEIVGYVKERYNFEFDADINELLQVFEEPDIKEMDEGEFSDLIGKSRPSVEGMIGFMCEEHGFSQERIRKAAEKIAKIGGAAKQKGIGSWMK